MPKTGKNIALALMLMIPFLGSSQNFQGIRSSKDGGIYSSFFNPTRILDVPGRYEVNVLGGDFSFLMGANSSSGQNFLKSGGTPDVLRITLLKDADAGFFSRLVFPSMIWKPKKHFAIGIIPQLRTVAFGRYTNPQLLTFLRDLFNGREATTASLPNKDEFAAVYLHTWIEVAIPVAYQMDQYDKHRFQIGGNLKILSGQASGRIQANNFSVSPGNLDSLRIGGSLSVLFNSSLDDLVTDQELKVKLFDRVGLGFDLGFRYTFFKTKEEKQENKYLFDVGLSFLDFGSVKYQPSQASSNYNFQNTPLLLQNIANSQSIAQLLDTIRGIEPDFSIAAESYRVNLPLRLALYGDWNVYDKFYLNIGSTFWLREFSNAPLLNDFYEVSITPRWQNKKMGFYLPMTIRKGIKNVAGFAFNYRTFSIGSGNLWSSLLNNSDTRQINLFLGASIRIK